MLSLKYSSSPVTLDTGFFDMGDGDSDEAEVTRQLLDTGLFDLEGDSSPGNKYNVAITNFEIERRKVMAWILRLKFEI